MTEDDSSGSGTRCRRCRKRILWPGLCYTCATGLPRRFRPRERVIDETPTPRVETSEQPGGPG